MPTSLSSDAIEEKNKTASASPFLTLMEVTLPDGTVIRLCENNEDITFDGQTWLGFPFELDRIDENAQGEIPRLTARVSNVARTLMAYVLEHDGMVGADVRIMTVHASHLDASEPEITLNYEIMGASSDENWVTFELGGATIFRKLFPKGVVRKDLCRFTFKSARCGYSGSETLCDRTLSRCRALGNSPRFGGFPGVGKRSIVI